MGLIKEVKCAECGAKAALLTRTKLGDGSFLCSKCVSGIPRYITKCLGDYTLEAFRSLKAYILESANELSKTFNQNHYYQGLHADTAHGLFCFDYGIVSKPLYLKFSNIRDFSLDFLPERYKEGAISGTVSGNVVIKLVMSEPAFRYENVLAYGVKAKVKRSLLGNKIDYSLPKDMVEFLHFFYSAWEDALVDQYEEYFNDTGTDTGTGADSMDELQQAMALFMLDDLTGVTLAEIKEHRNRLIKTFHPDASSAADTRYAQKINAAYEIIKKHLS